MSLKTDIVVFLLLTLTSGYFLLQPIRGEVQVTIPVMLSGDALLTCPVSVGSPPAPAAQWVGPGSKIIATRGVLSRVLDPSKYRLIAAGTPGGGPTLIVSRVGLEDDGVYCCQDANTLQDLHCINVTVLVSVQSLNLLGPSGAINEGSEVKVICITEGSKPAPEIVWLKTDTDGVLTRLQGAIHDRVHRNGTVQRNSTLTVRVGRTDYLASYVCAATVSIFPIQSAWMPDVYLSPTEPWVLTDRAIYRPGDVAHFHCVTSGSRPAARITWSIDGQPLSESNPVNSRERRDEDGTFSSSSRWSMTMSRGSNGAKVTCGVTNVVLTSQGEPPRSADVRLVVEYAPVLSINVSRPEVSEGEDARFYCSVEAEPAVPAENVHLVLNDHFLPEDRVRRMEEQLVVVNVSRLDRGRYHCVARNSHGTGISSTVTLTVQFSPVCVHSDLKPFHVTLGHSASLPCLMEAVPHDVIVTWVRRLTNETLRSNMPVTWRTGDVAESVLQMKIRAYEDIECRARNSVGQTSSPCVLRPRPPQPPEAPHSCLILRLPNGSRQLRCIPGQDGGSPVTFVLRVQGETVKNDNSVASARKEPRFVLDGLDTAGTELNVTVCAVSQSFPRSPVCGVSLMLRADTAVLHASSAGPGSKVYIVVGAVLACCFIAAVIVIVIVCKRRRRKVRRNPQKRYDAEFRGQPSYDTGSERTVNVRTRTPAESFPPDQGLPDTPDIDRALLSAVPASVSHILQHAARTDAVLSPTDRRKADAIQDGVLPDQTQAGMDRTRSKTCLGGTPIHRPDSRKARPSDRSSGSFSLPKNIRLHPGTKVYVKADTKSEGNSREAAAGVRQTSVSERESHRGNQRQLGPAAEWTRTNPPERSMDTGRYLGQNGRERRYLKVTEGEALLPKGRQRRYSSGSQKFSTEQTMKPLSIQTRDKRLSDQREVRSAVRLCSRHGPQHRFSDPTNQSSFANIRQTLHSDRFFSRSKDRGQEHQTRGTNYPHNQSMAVVQPQSSLWPRADLEASRTGSERERRTLYTYLPPPHLHIS